MVKLVYMHGSCIVAWSQVKDVADLGSLQDAARLLVPRESPLLCQSEQPVVSRVALLRIECCDEFLRLINSLKSNEKQAGHLYFDS